MIKLIKSKRKVLYSMIIGLLITTQFTGCFIKSKSEVVTYFNDFTEVFPTKDLTVFMDGQAEDTKQSLKGYSKASSISCYLDTKTEKGDKTVGISLGTEDLKGNFIIRVEENEKDIDNKYPVYYDKDGIYLVDENVDESVKEEVENFKIPYNFISLDKDYLKSLKCTNNYYNFEVPSYGITYKLKADDKNIQKIRELYPDFPIEDDNLVLYFEGDGEETKRHYNLTIYLDKDHTNYFSVYLTLE